jgi:hypothetical protein
MRWQAALLSLLSILWLQFGSVHLHFDGHGEQPHVHSLLSAHHADLHPQHAEADIDLTPDAAATSASQLLLDLGLILAFVAFLVPLLIASGSPARSRGLPAQTLLFHTSPPLRAPPANS